jgi:CRISPR-associated protein Csc3
MIQIALLEQAIDPGDDLLRRFVRQVVPGMMHEYTFVPAKGGRFADERRAEGIDVEHFDRDQSMLGHLLNGIFPTMHLMRLLVERGVRQLSDLEKQVYLVAYCLHDLDKILRQWGLDTHDRAAIDAVVKEAVRQIETLGMDTFFPEFHNYLNDIVFLAVNTQRAKGTHLNTYLFQPSLKERQLSVLRQLCTYSDVIAYTVRSPADIVYGRGARSLMETLAFLSQDTLSFAYHKFNEVRGLLTNVLTNSVMHMLHEQSLIPYLFFPNGVVYLVDREERGLALAVSQDDVVRAARRELERICAKKIIHDAPGFKFDQKGLVKKPDYYHDFLSASDYVRMIGKQAIRMTVRDISTSPLQKMQEMQAQGLIPGDIDVTFEPDLRVGVLARFLVNLWKEALDRLPDEEMRSRVQAWVLERLGMTNLWPTAERIPGKGGVEYKWFWLAAQYLKAHPGIDIQQGEGNLSDLFDEIMDLVLPDIEGTLDQVMVGSYLPYLATYLAETLELYPTSPVMTQPSFAAELARYAGAKQRRKPTLMCTLCHSAYPTGYQADSSVLFQPWVYKNKLPLYATSNAGGICAICALELMLRQIMLKGELRLTGSKFEALRSKYFYLYPAYFFTTETAQIVRWFVDRFKFINFFEVRKQLRNTAMLPADFLSLDNFIVEEEDVEELADSGYLKMQYPPDSFPALVFFGMKAGSRDSDTEAWVLPAFLALALSLVLNVKVVVSESPVPLFASGDDFKETVVFDGPHPYLGHLLTADRIRIDRVHENLARLTGIYLLNMDTFADGPRPNWNQLNGVVRRIATDPLWIFAYLRRQQRGDSFYAGDASRYIQLYQQIGGNMSLIKGCVDRYTVFYSGGYKSHSITKPVDMVAKTIINSEPGIDPEDLKLEIRGELMQWMDRVRRRQAEGYAKFWGKDVETQEMPAIRDFVDYFYDEVFQGYCRGERGVLRSRINRFRDGCEAYYAEKRAVDKAEREAAERAEANQ